MVTLNEVLIAGTLAKYPTNQLPGQRHAGHERAAAEGADIRHISPARLAFLAAGDGPVAAQARGALRLLPEPRARVTMAQLAAQAAKGDQDAQVALEALKALRSTGVQGERPRKGRRTEETEASRSRKERKQPVPAPGNDPTTFRGERFEGRGMAEDPDMPTVKSFKRVK